MQARICCSRRWRAVEPATAAAPERGARGLSRAQALGPVAARWHAADTRRIAARGRTKESAPERGARGSGRALLPQLVVDVLAHDGVEVGIGLHAERASVRRRRSRAGHVRDDARRSRGRAAKRTRVGDRVAGDARAARRPCRRR
ncbi:MAG: hypothetical protein MZW92_33030 [Comamonadaceae bacterium]|nr:hypothetical protein [Comamonadaceae bacterium]